MATLILTDLAPGRTATLQLYQRGTNTTSGSLITGTSVSTTYSFAGVPATGDYDGQISGFTTPDGDRFPIRNAIGYPGVEWSVVDEIDPPPSTPNTCEITLRASRAGTQKQVRVRIVSLGSSGRLAERAFVNLAIDQDTDANGLLIFRLPWSSTPGIGRYRVRLLDLETNEVLHDRVCTVPDEDILDYEDLPGGTLPAGTESFGLLIRQAGGSPSGTISTLIVPDGSLAVSGGTATLTVSGGGGGSGANLSTSTTSTTVVIASDSGTDATIAAASGSAAGVMTSAMFTKLDGIATGATANSADATLLARANHTGTQAWSTITATPTTLSGYGITDAASSTHAHGNITNAGAIGSTANLPIITGASGVLTVGSFGTTANTFCQGNDSRVVNAIGNTFETVAKNLRSFPATPTYSGALISSVGYNTGSGTITKTVNRTGNQITSIVLSGATPSGIQLTKTIARSGNQVTGITYS